MDSLILTENPLNSEVFQRITSEHLRVDQMVHAFIQHYQQVWWQCGSNLPVFPQTYTNTEQVAHEKQLENLVNGFIHEMKHIPHANIEKQDWINRLVPVFNNFMMDTFHLNTRQLDFIQSSGVIDSIQSFVKMARQFDVNISLEDVYQAGRNVVTANLIQLLLGLPARITPSIFAYSMLYPYTDNYLDDGDIPASTKAAFNHRFHLRLLGEEVKPVNTYEAKINRLISMIEDEWDRGKYPLVYESLLSIHKAQTHSLDLVLPDGSPFERDILGISFEKGGTSVMTDGFLAAGSLSADQARVLFGFGAFTQLMDDLEDVRADMLDRRASIFSITAPNWKLDKLTNHYFHFGRSVISDLNVFNGKDVPLLSDLMSTCVHPMLVNNARQSAGFHSNSYLSTLETHLPFRFKSIEKQHKKLISSRLDIPRLMAAFLE